MTPYMCTKCGKSHKTMQDVKNCDHKKPTTKKKATTVKKVEETKSLDL